MLRLEKNSGSFLMLASCKFNLARVYNQLEDLTSSSNAENLLKECTEMYSSIKDQVKIMKCQDEMIRMLLKQERYDVNSLLFLIIYSKISVCLY